MTCFWHVFVVVGTLGNITAIVWLFLANRTPGTFDEDGNPLSTGHNFDGIEELDNPLPDWWVGMLLACVVFALAYLLWFPALGTWSGIGGWTSADRHQQRASANAERYADIREQVSNVSLADFAANPDAQRMGRRLYINNCAVCHQQQRAGTFGFPDLTDAAWQWGGTEQQILTTIRDGRQALMTPWLAVLGEDGVRDVAHYVLRISNQEHTSDAADRGTVAYQQFCVACHGTQGSGNETLGAPNLVDQAWLYGGSFEEIAFSIRNGRDGHMPPFGDRLHEAELRILTRYVLAQAEPAP